MCIEQSTIYGFLRTNGAGKTTIFKLLTGLLIPDSGSIEILGTDMLKNRDRMLSQIGSLIESPTFYGIFRHVKLRNSLSLYEYSWI